MLLESLILGFPVFILVDDTPSASFIVKSILVSVICICILLPLFGPKHLKRNSTATREEQVRSSKVSGSKDFRSSDAYNSGAFSQAGRSTSVISGLHIPTTEIHQSDARTEQPAKVLRGSRIIRRDLPRQSSAIRFHKQTPSGKVRSSLTPGSWANADFSGALNSNDEGRTSQTYRLPSMDEDPVKEEEEEKAEEVDNGEERANEGPLGDSKTAGQRTMTSVYRQSFPEFED